MPDEFQGDSISAMGPNSRYVVERTLSKWDPRKWRLNSTVAFYGRRRRGKNTVVSDFIYHNRDRLQNVLAVSPTDCTNKAWSKRMPGMFIRGSLSKDDIQAVQDRQTLLLENPPADYAQRGLGTEFVLALDDCMAEDGIKSAKMNELFSNGRHLNMGCIVLVQYVKQLPKKLRQNVEVVVILREDSATVLKMIYEEHLSSCFDEFDEFVEYVREYTKDYGVLVYDANDSEGGDGNGKHAGLYWYKADAELDRREDWKIGEKTLWPFHHAFHSEHNKRKHDYRTGSLPVPLFDESGDPKSGKKRRGGVAATEEQQPVKIIYRRNDERGQPLPDTPAATRS